MKKLAIFAFVALSMIGICIFSSCDKACLHIDMSEQVIEATCDSEGKTLKVCNDCGFKYQTDFVAPKGHTLTETVTAPDCLNGGYTTYTCECGYTEKKEFVSPTGHKFTKAVTKPDCINEGYTTYFCDCGYTYKANFVAPTGHTLSRTVTPPDCTHEGYTTYTCDCGYTYKSDFVAPAGHSFKTSVVEPDCESYGYTTYTCDCGYSYEGDMVAPRGHVFAETRVYSTAGEMGYTVYTCDCSFSYKGNYVFYSDYFQGAYAKNSVVLAKGVDISKYQHATDENGNYLPLDWELIKATGVEYVILKAGSTTRTEDGVQKGGIEPTFEMDYADAKAAGLDVGIYFYTYSTTVEGVENDVRELLSWIEGKTFEYPVYFDLEDESQQTLGSELLFNMCFTFCTELQSEGYYTGVYTNAYWLTDLLPTERMLALFDIWYARYPLNTTDYVWDEEKYGPHLGMWQYTESQSIEGFEHDLFDMNYCYKDYPTIIKKLGLNGYSVNS